MVENPSADHVERVRKELLAAGVTKYGLLKGESRHLAKIIHEDEHIGGVVYGRYKKTSAMLVATELRVLFLDYKILFRKSDELSYDIISGVSLNDQATYAGVTLHTRLGDYMVRFVNLKAAHQFADFVETRKIAQDYASGGQSMSIKPAGRASMKTTKPKVLNSAAQTFLQSNDLGVLSTIDRDGQVHGAAVYYAEDNQGYIYLVTKDKTNKAQNVLSNQSVALTIFNADNLQTLQLRGVAHIETDPEIVDPIYRKILHPRVAGAHVNMPPILSLPAGGFVVICITPTDYQFTDYKSGILGEQ